MAAIASGRASLAPRSCRLAHSGVAPLRCRSQEIPNPIFPEFLTSSSWQNFGRIGRSYFRGVTLLFQGACTKGEGPLREVPPTDQKLSSIFRPKKESNVFPSVAHDTSRTHRCGSTDENYDEGAEEEEGGRRGPCLRHPRAPVGHNREQDRPVRRRGLLHDKQVVSQSAGGSEGHHNGRSPRRESEVVRGSASVHPKLVSVGLLLTQPQARGTRRVPRQRGGWRQ